MYTVIRQYKIAPEQLEEVLRLGELEFVPLLSRLPGFLHYYGLDVGNGTVVTVSVFSDKAGAEASNRLADEWGRERLARFLVYPPETIGGEVRIALPSPL